MSLHTHPCYCCEEEIVCACADRRQTDRATGKERRILCLWCQGLQDMLQAVFKDERTLLEKVQ